MIKVLVVEDQPVVREGLKMLINQMEQLTVIETAADGEEALTLYAKYKPDVVLMDIKMPNMNGVEATKRLKELDNETKIIILTTFNDDEYIFEALKNGASGYLLKDAPPEKIEEAIHEVYKGGALIQPDIAQKVISRIQDWDEPEEIEQDSRINLLTDREKDILRLIGEGKNNDEISQLLFITRGTVKNHITKILFKLDLRDRTQIAIFALKNHIV